MRAWLLLAVACVACKDKAKPAGDTSTLTVDMTRCEQAIDKAAAAPLAARPQILLDGCWVCGSDWQPLLRWNVDPEAGGPKREQIEKLMVACDAFCTGDSKMKFMAGVDKARGQSVNTPWRQLATTCKAKVNASPDDRFMSAPYFALDRIARKMAGHSAALASKLAAIELPLPAVTVSGAGVVLPDADGVDPDVAAIQITVLGDAIHVGRMPRATLGAAGVTAELGIAGYPGDQVKLEELGAKLSELIGGDKTQTIALLAPHAMPAQNLVPIVAAAAAVAPVYLAANAAEAPEGWQLAGAIPVALEPGADLEISDEMTVQNLARELATRAARKQTRIGVTKQ
jgi:hypothetical protein